MTELKDEVTQEDIADAVNDAEHSLLIWTDAAWNGQIAGDARDFCRAQFGVFALLREKLSLPPYSKPPFQERDFDITRIAHARPADDVVEALRKAVARQGFSNYELIDARASLAKLEQTA